MKSVSIKIFRYSFLFVILYFCSAIVLKLLQFFGINYRNTSNVAFYGALFAVLLLLLINKIKKCKERQSFLRQKKSSSETKINEDYNVVKENVSFK